jgi:hypothetical protein
MNYAAVHLHPYFDNLAIVGDKEFSGFSSNFVK